MPSEKQPDWRERLKKEFPGLFYKELTMRGVSSNYDARKELESFIEQLLKEERERIIALVEGMEKPINKVTSILMKKRIDSKGMKKELNPMRHYNQALSDLLKKIKM